MDNYLKLHKYFYKKEAVYKASVDYRSLANIKIEENEDCLICIFNDYIIDIELMKKEFSNYVLAVMIKEKGF